MLAVVRNPLAQIVGWSKSPYDLASCVQNRDRGAGAEWLERQCRFSYSVPMPDWDCDDGCKACLHSSHTFKFASLPEVWNLYSEGYAHLAAMGFSGLVLRYESLVLDPEASVERIAQFLGRAAPPALAGVEESAKGHGASHGRRTALAKLAHKPWLSYLRPEEVRAVCARLDPALLRRFDYDDCSDDESAGSELGTVGPRPESAELHAALHTL